MQACIRVDWSAFRMGGLKCSKELMAVLQRFFYINRIYRKGVEDIWDEVSVLMNAL